MVRIILIRPGSTDYDQQHRIQGNLDIPLNQQGSDEVARLIDQLGSAEIAAEIEAVYAPPCEPARQTAEAVAEALGTKYRKLDRMKNLDHGLWQGMCINEVKRKQPKVYRQWQEQPESVCPPEGEMLEQAERRASQSMTKLLKRHKNGGTIALVLPEPMASVVRRYFDHGALGDLWKATTVHGCWEAIEVRREVPTASR